jgi:hypothetical protein
MVYWAFTSLMNISYCVILVNPKFEMIFALDVESQIDCYLDEICDLQNNDMCIILAQFTHYCVLDYNIDRLQY